MSDRYIYHVPKEDHLVGLLHQRLNLFSLLMEAKYLNRIAIIPPLHLNGKHNNGKSLRCTWDRYIVLDRLKAFHTFVTLAEFGHIDIKNCALVDENTKPEDIINDDNSLIVRKHRKYPNYYKLISFFSHNNWENKLINLLHPSKQVSKYSNIAIMKMKIYHCIHVRRGDKLNLKECPGVNKKTRPEYLIKYLLKYISKGENLYVMSNEKEPNYFKPLENIFNLFTYKDFPEFVTLIQADNYLLFSVENEIMKHAKTKIKTFKEQDYLSLLQYPSTGKDSYKSKIIGELLSLLKPIKSTLVKILIKLNNITIL